MKPLLSHLHRNGVFYSLEQRTGNVALFSLRYAQRGPIIGFDCFRVRLAEGRVFDGKTIPPYEQFPRNSAYGSSARSYTTKEAALKKFNELTFGPVELVDTNTGEGCMESKGCKSGVSERK